MFLFSDRWRLFTEPVEINLYVASYTQRSKPNHPAGISDTLLSLAIVAVAAAAAAACVLQVIARKMASTRQHGTTNFAGLREGVSSLKR